jgi:NDP-sugar pyrophosphorylase family protein
MIDVLALIMAGGSGKRLRPLTDKIPKPLVRVGGKPIIYWQIKWLESFGVDRFVLLGGYKSEKLVEYIKSIGYYDKFRFSIESAPLGTAGAMSKARKLLEGEREFLVVNADNVTNLDVRRLRLGRGQLSCLAIVPYKSTKGIVRFRGNMITKFEEKRFIDGCWVNAGIMLVSSKILPLLPRSGSLESEILPKLARVGKLSCVKFEKPYFNSADYFKDVEEIDRDLKSGKVRFA